MDGFDFSICILKMNLQCCKDCPLRVKKLLQKITGVYAITIDPKEGLVLISGTAEPSVIIKAIEGLGKSPDLYAYEKDPRKAKIEFRALLKRYAGDNSSDKDSGSGDGDGPRNCGGSGGENFGPRRPGFIGPPPPFPPPIQIPMITPARPPGPPGWLATGPRQMYMEKYEQPTVTTKKAPSLYPFDIYETNAEEMNVNPLFTYFSDQNAQPCNII